MTSARGVNRPQRSSPTRRHTYVPPIALLLVTPTSVCSGDFFTSRLKSRTTTRSTRGLFFFVSSTVRSSTSSASTSVVASDLPWINSSFHSRFVVSVYRSFSSNR